MSVTGVAHAAASATFYTSPGGAASAACSQASPCSLSGAQAQVRSFLRGNPGADVTVLVGDGTYRLTGGLDFGAADSGSAGHPVVWQAAPGAHHSGRCLDDPASSSSPGTQVQIWDCNGAANQTWVSPIAGPVTGYSALCLDVRAAQNADGTPVQVYTCNDTGAQYWNRTPDSALQALGKCLDIAGGGTANGTPVQLWTCNGGGGQQWVPQADGTLRNPASGKCLDSGGSGTQVQIWDCNASTSQKWTLP